MSTENRFFGDGRRGGGRILRTCPLSAKIGVFLLTYSLNPQLKYPQLILTVGALIFSAWISLKYLFFTINFVNKIAEFEVAIWSAKIMRRASRYFFNYRPIRYLTRSRGVGSSGGCPHPLPVGWGYPPPPLPED